MQEEGNTRKRLSLATRRGPSVRLSEQNPFLLNYLPFECYLHRREGWRREGKKGGAKLVGGDVEFGSAGGGKKGIALAPPLLFQVCVKMV